MISGPERGDSVAACGRLGKSGNQCFPGRPSGQAKERGDLIVWTFTIREAGAGRRGGAGACVFAVRRGKGKGGGAPDAGPGGAHGGH